jgi:uncharacterized protein
MTEKSSDIAKKMVLGTAQFGMDYGIANVSGKPSKQEVFNILELAWERGVRRFDTAPGYGSEMLLGEFIANNGMEREAILLTKFSGLKEGDDYKSVIKSSLESSLKKLGCKIEVLFFHDPKDSELLMNNPSFFKSLLDEYPVSTLGVSVYEPHEVEKLSNCGLELAFQFPFNILDRRFGKITMPAGRGYARSIFLQGLLVSANGLRTDAPAELLEINNQYHKLLKDYNINPINFAVSFVTCSSCVDYFMVGVELEKQLIDILNIEFDIFQDLAFLDPLLSNVSKKWLDPRKWN